MSSHSTIHVLLIEDSLSDQFLMSERLTTAFASRGITLSLAGVAFHVQLARDRLEQLAALGIDNLLVIVDLNLPDSRGVATYRTLAAALAPVRHLVVSEDLSAIEELAAEGVPAIRKGADMADLADRVMQLMGITTPS